MDDAGRFTLPESRLPRAATLTFSGHTPEEALAARWRLLEYETREAFRTLRRQVRDESRLLAVMHGTASTQQVRHGW